MKFLDLFSGIGGFRIAMEMAGHECVGHCEIDKYADKSYRAMHDVKESEWYASDIRAVRASELPRADCWCFGFPCQDISVAGKQLGFAGHRSSLFFAVTKLIRDTKEEDRPKYLIAENVKNFFSVNNGYDFLKAIIELDEIGYDTEWQLLNTKNFGLPQNRERVFIVGHLRGSGGRKVFPISGGNSETLKQIIPRRDAERVYSSDGIARTLKAEAGGQGAKTGLYIIGKDGNQKNKDYASCLTAGGHSGGNHSDMDLLVEPYKSDKNGNAKCLDANYHKGLLANQERTGVRIYDLYNHKKKEDGICGTLTANGNTSTTHCGTFGVMIYQTPRGNNEGGLKEIAPTLTKNSYEHNNHLVHGDISKTVRTGGRNSPYGSKQNWDTYEVEGRIRRLTPKECFRLQGYPDEYFERARAVNSDLQLYKQAGNSVSIPPVYEIARRL